MLVQHPRGESPMCIPSVCKYFEGLYILPGTCAGHRRINKTDKIPCLHRAYSLSLGGQTIPSNKAGSVSDGGNCWEVTQALLGSGAFD